MPKAYSDDLRVRIVRAVDAGASRRSTAAKFEVSVSFVIRLVQQWRATGSARIRGTGGRPRHRLEPHAELVDRLLAAKRDITLEELRSALAGEGVAVSRSGVDRYLKARGDCQDFRVRAGIVGKKETQYVPTQRACDTG
ncbi:MAG: helix-turn-helix domain-containing protein [Sphingomonas sp.]